MANDVDPIIQEAIDAVDGTANLAQRLGIQAPSIYSWKRVPPNRVLAVEAATGISRHRLRPDLYPRDPPKPAKRRATPPPVAPAEVGE